MIKKSTSDRTFGFVLFDDIFESRSGWAYAVKTDSSVRRIHKLEDLPSETIWWSNAPSEFFLASMRFNAPPCLRHVNYLLVNPYELLNEWNMMKSMPEQMKNPANRCIFLANAFSSIMTIAFDLIKRSTDVYTINQAFIGKTLIEDLKQLLPREYRPIKPEKKNKYTKANTNKRFNDSIRPVSKLHYIPTRANRFYHIRKMLGFKIPDLTSPLDYIPDSRIRQKQAELTGLKGFLAQKEYPAMIDIIIRDSEDKFVSLYGMSVKYSPKYRKNMHNWVALLEILRSSKDSTMKVQGICVPTKSVTFMESLSEPVKTFFNDDFMECSWSAGVLAESLWYAATYKLVQLENHRFDQNGNFPETSWQSEWVLGANEAFMIDDKRKYVESGYYAASYGPGWVKVGVFEDFVIDLIDDSIGFGFLPDLIGLQKEIPITLERRSWGGGDLSFLLAHSQFTANSNLMGKLDNLPSIPSNHRLQYLEKLKVEFGFPSN